MSESVERCDIGVEVEVEVDEEEEEEEETVGCWNVHGWDRKNRGPAARFTDTRGLPWADLRAAKRTCLFTAFYKREKDFILFLVCLLLLM